MARKPRRLRMLLREQRVLFNRVSSEALGDATRANLRAIRKGNMDTSQGVTTSNWDPEYLGRKCNGGRMTIRLVRGAGLAEAAARAGREGTDRKYIRGPKGTHATKPKVQPEVVKMRVGTIPSHTIVMIDKATGDRLFLRTKPQPRFEELGVKTLMVPKDGGKGWPRQSPK